MSSRLPDGSIPVLVSSDREDLLRAEAYAIHAYLQRKPGVGPDEVADMLLRTRTARRRRALAMVHTRTQLLDALGAVAAGEPHPAVIANDTPAGTRRIAMVFPGQGSQRAGMGRIYHEQSPEYRAAVEECDGIFHDLYRTSPMRYLLDDTHGEDELRLVQPALMMQMLGLAAMWRAAGVHPAVTIGHSQGELAAAVVSGVMTLTDAVRTVTLRAGLVDTLEGERAKAPRTFSTKGSAFSMAVLGVDRDECEALLARRSGFAELSVINSMHVVAISGERDTVGDIVAELNGTGRFAKEIRVAYPAHTSMVGDFREEFCTRDSAGVLDNACFRVTDIECIGSTLGAAMTPDLPVDEYWYWNLRNRVRFDLAVAAAINRGVDTFIEVAEHPMLMLALTENLTTCGVARDFQVIGTSRRTARGLEEFTRNLAVAAVGNADYDWSTLSVASGRPPRPPLFDFPNTRMNRQHLWAAYEPVHRPPPGTYPEPTALDRRAAPVRLRETWDRLPARSLMSPRTVAILDHTGRNGETVKALRAAAARHRVVVVDDNRSMAAVDTVLLLAGQPGDSGIGPAVSALADFVDELGRLPDLTSVKDLWLVTTGGEHVLESDVPDLFGSAAGAAFRCLVAEHPGTTVRRLDLPAGQPATASADQAIVAVHTAAEPELALRGDHLYAKRLIADDSTVTSQTDTTPGEVMITGGTGKIGLEICEQLVRAGARRVTLLGRSGGTPDTHARLEQLRTLGTTEILMRTCDVSDEGAVAALATEYRNTPLDLIVHATVDYNAAAGHDATAVRRAAAPKIIAADHVVRHLPRARTGRVVLCSSLSATIGGRGHMVYAAVNRMLDTVATHYRRQGIACTSVQWGLWRQVGTQLPEALGAIRSTGLSPMDPVAATAAGVTRSTGEENVIVAAADWERLKEIFTTLGFGPLFTRMNIPRPEPIAAATTPPPPESETIPTPAVDADTAEHVRSVLRTVMGMTASESIDSAAPLITLGLDSLQAMDLRKHLSSELGRDLPITAILGGASLDEIVALLETRVPQFGGGMDGRVR